MIVTNKASSVFAAIEKIASTSSKLEKEQLIKVAGNSSPLFMKVVKAAYDPYTTYGMARMPEKPAGTAPGANTLDEDHWWGILSDMASRKLTGNAAKEAVIKALCFLDEPSAELFRRIIRKDLRAGFTDGTINRVFPKTLAEFPYMRCSLPDKSNMPEWDWSVGIVSQEKADGMFANVDVDVAGQVTMTTRAGSPIPLDHLQELEAACSATLAKCSQTHGELTVYKDGVLMPREEGNGVLNSIINGGELPGGHTVRFDAWDQIPAVAVKSKGKYITGYRQRLRTLLGQVQAAVAETRKDRGVHVIPTRIVRSKAGAMEHYRELLKLGKEGTICKHPDAIWKDGTSKDQVKLKMEVDVDLEVVNILMGTPGTKNEGKPGSLECRTSCGGLSVAVTVKNEKMRAAVNDDWIGNIMPVRFNSIMEPDSPDGIASLFLPRFVEDTPRTDKRQADTLEQVREQFKAVVNA